MLNDMCNFSVGFLQEGKRIGERIGIKKGEKIGVEKGVCKSIIKFMKKTSCSIDVALNFFDITNEESAIYIDMINQLSTQKG